LSIAVPNDGRVNLWYLYDWAELRAKLERCFGM